MARLARLEEVHTEPGVLLQRPGVGLLLLFDAHKGIACQWPHLAAHVKQLELGASLSQKFGQGIDGSRRRRHGEIRLMVMRADYKALAEDSQWQQTCAAADINMAAMRGEVYSIALF